MSSPRLFHVSEEAEIRLFEPRPTPSPDAGVQGRAVWAIDEVRLPNYLLPRDCPRVTYAANELTSQLDRQKFLTGTTARRVIALESTWFPKIEACQLFLYEFWPDTFELIDPCAGYYISRVPVEPKSVIKIKDLVSELLNRDIEIRFLPSLWDLKEAVTDSSLEFSVIRFRHASPRP